MAVYQSLMCKLTHRHRRQASSHISQHFTVGGVLGQVPRFMPLAGNGNAVL